jgi:hypothetical protein
MLVLTAISVMSGMATPALAVETPRQSSSELSIEQIRVGFGGSFKVGRWTSISVEIKVKRPCTVHWSIEVPDPHGNPTQFPGPATKFANAGLQTLKTVFRTGRLDGSLRVRVGSDGNEVERLLRTGDDDIAALRPALKQSVVLVGVLGQPAGLSDLQKLERPVQIVNLDDAADLPTEYSAYEGLDILIINGSPAITRPQSDAIRDWVYSGGRLTLAVGRDTTAFQNGSIYQWVSEFIPLLGTRELRKLRGLESFDRGTTPITVRRGQPVTAARIDIGDNESDTPTFAGHVLVTEEREPLVVRSACGFGRITFLGVDLDVPPLSDWKPLSDVLQRLVFDEFPPASDQGSNRGQRLSQTGVSDLATQLQSASEDFPGLDRISTWTVMTLLIVYLMLIGPADYFLVHRVFRNPRMTWVSFPILVCVAAALAIWTAHSTNSQDVRLNQIDLVDIDAAPNGPQFVRSQSWLTVYTPSTVRNQVAVLPRSLQAEDNNLQPDETTAANTDVARENGPFRLSWAGVPETGFGGMYRSGGIEFGRPSYRYTAGGAGIDDLPTAMWSTASLTASRTHRSEGLVESDLTSRGFGLLSGTLTHHLGGPLREWMLAYGPGVYFSKVNPRTGEAAIIEPNTAWSPDGPSVHQQELLGYLTQTRLKAVKGSDASNRKTAEYRLAQSTYDPFSREPAGILRMITFYRRAGGEKYTQLNSDSLRHFDYTGLLELDRAILFARVDTPVADLKWNDKPLTSTRRSTFVRIVLPVRQSKK